jgi:hypothetical protein
MCDRVVDWPAPFETKIAIAGLHRQSRHLSRLHAGPMNIELLVAEAIGKAARRPRHQFGAEHLGIERVGALPFRHVNDAMVEFGWKHDETFSGLVQLQHRDVVFWLTPLNQHKSNLDQENLGQENLR